jgi:hypothetical protein
MCITGNGSFAGQKRLLRQAKHHDRVLAAREQQHGALELGCDLAHDVDRFGLQGAEVGELVRHGNEKLTRPVGIPAR